FQAEDGIRDFHVTGVQTCALPILKTNKDWGGDGKLKRKVEDYIWREQYLDNKTRIVPVEDIVTCDKFLIRFIIDKSGYIIFITALDKTPAYLFCFGLTCNLCGFHQL